MGNNPAYRGQACPECVVHVINSNTLRARGDAHSPIPTHRPLYATTAAAAITVRHAFEYKAMAGGALSCSPDTWCVTPAPEPGHSAHAKRVGRKVTCDGAQHTWIKVHEPF